MRIMLVRHTQADLEPGICYGRLDAEVRSLAEVDAFARSLPLDGFRRVVTSPARRCRVLADALAQRCATAPVDDDRLLELDFGSWEGRDWTEIPRTELDPWAAQPLTVAPPRGETGARLIARVRRARHDILRGPGDCVVVAHGGPLKLMLALLRGAPPDLLAQAPPLASATVIHIPDHAITKAESTTHSTNTAQQPSTSPV